MLRDLKLPTCLGQLSLSLKKEGIEVPRNYPLLCAADYVGELATYFKLLLVDSIQQSFDSAIHALIYSHNAAK